MRCLTLTLVAVVTAALICSNERCGYHCPHATKCMRHPLCYGQGDDCLKRTRAAAPPRNATYAPADDAANFIEWRSSGDAARCRRARCGAVAPYGRRASKPDDLFRRYATFAGELLVVTPHKGASKYIKSMFASAYGCVFDVGSAKGEEVHCGDEGKIDAAVTLAVVVRDPVDRALAMYNHFVGDGALESICARVGEAAASNGSHSFRASPPNPPKGFKVDRAAVAAAKLPRLEAWLACVAATLADVGRTRYGIEFRHFQPDVRYAFASEAAVVGRVERLGDLVAALAAKLPRLNASLAPGGGGTWPEPWLADTGARAAYERIRHADEVTYEKGHDRQIWGVTRCDLAADPAAANRFDAAIRRAYATDYACFGAVLPVPSESDAASDGAGGASPCAAYAEGRAVKIGRAHV